MQSGELKLGELKKAITRLKEVLALPKDDVVRDSAIQRFEFTVELSWKALQRFLKASGMSENLTPRNVFREAAKLNIIQDPERWFQYLDARNLSSHTYQESLAEDVYRIAQTLPPYAEALLQRLEETP